MFSLYFRFFRFLKPTIDQHIKNVFGLRREGRNFNGKKEKNFNGREGVDVILFDSKGVGKTIFYK